MRIRSLTSEFWLPTPRERLFPFFSSAHNLDQITPPWLHFSVLTPRDVPIGEGTLLDYRLRLHGIPLSWQSEITEWRPPERFVDEQRKGPYRLWIHEHTFVEKEGGTVVGDHVSYCVPGGSLLEPFFYHLLVGPDVARIFEFRRKRLEELCRGGVL